MTNPFTRRRFLRYAATTPLLSSCLRAAAAKPSTLLFDGESLEGWHTTPRLYVPRSQEFAAIPSKDLKEAVVKHHRDAPDAKLRARAANRGVWKVEDGAIIGGQVPGTTDGAYLMSNQTYGDFDLAVEARPDWPIDTGIMIRAHALGTVGFQVLLDTRPGGCVGGLFGNGIGGFRAFPFVVDGDEQENFRVANLREGVLNREKIRPDYSAPFKDFAAIWKPNEWNNIRIRCQGEMPLVETWINGAPIMKLDTAKLHEKFPTWDAKVVKERLGNRGHIAFEVHDSHNDRERWAPGAVCRWRNVRIQEL